MGATHQMDNLSIELHYCPIDGMSDHIAGTHQKWFGAFISDVVVPEAGIDGAAGCGHGRGREAISAAHPSRVNERPSTVRR